jgi:hypothetical protein
VLSFLSARRVRGRGGVGARQDEAGPFLPAAAGAGAAPPPAAVPPRRLAPLGPALPPHLQRRARSPEADDRAARKAAKKARKHAAKAEALAHVAGT